MGQKYESGWKFNIGSGEISVGSPTRSSDSRTSGTGQGQVSKVPTSVSSTDSATEAEYRKKAEKGDAKAQFELARLLYRNAGGPKKDQVEIVEWLRKSAEQGFAEAQWFLGEENDLFIEGSTEAEKWFRKAAEQGNPVFQYELGEKYEGGHRTIPRNESIALDWYRKAAKQGNTNAASRLQVLLDPERMPRLDCSRNLRAIAAAFRFWSMDHDDKFPFNFSSNWGGTMELSSRGDDGFERNAAIHFRAIATARAIAGELSSPKVFVCPADTSKHAATNFQTLQDMNVSYRLRSGSNVKDTRPNEILAECPIHGTVALCDGTTQFVSKKR